MSINMTESITASCQIDTSSYLNTLRPRQNGCHFPDNIFKGIFLNENEWISLKISLKFVPKVRINNIPALVQIMAWRRRGDKPLSEPMMFSLLTHICVTRPQWVNQQWPRACRINSLYLLGGGHYDMIWGRCPESMSLMIGFLTDNSFDTMMAHAYDYKLYQLLSTMPLSTEFKINTSIATTQMSNYAKMDNKICRFSKYVYITVV